RLPRGSVVRVVAHYDNSPHARNPHRPPKLVKWGPEVTDEMCVGYIAAVKAGQDLTRPGEKDDLCEILVKQDHKHRPRAQVAGRAGREGGGPGPGGGEESCKPGPGRRPRGGSWRRSTQPGKRRRVRPPRSRGSRYREWPWPRPAMTGCRAATGSSSARRTRGG